jgi:hypothetical protein
MLRWRWISPALLVLGLLTGCTQYQYSGQSFTSAEEAEAAIQADVDSKLATVTPVEEPLGGSLLAVIPTRAVIVTKSLTTQGPASGEMVNYVVNASEIQILAIVQGIEAGKIFDSVTIEQADDVAETPFDQYDYKLWLQIENPTSVFWYLQRGTEREPVAIDMRSPVPDQFDAINRNVVQAGQDIADH